jgi:hypothetical protein
MMRRPSEAKPVGWMKIEKKNPNPVAPRAQLLVSIGATL